MKQEQSLTYIKHQVNNANKVVYFKGYFAVSVGLLIAFGGLFAHYTSLIPAALGILAFLYCIAEWLFAKSVKEVFPHSVYYYLFSVFNLLLCIAFFLSLLLSLRFQVYVVYMLLSVWMMAKGIMLLIGVLDMRRLGIGDLFFFALVSVLTILCATIILFSLERRAVFVAIVFGISFITSGLAEIALSHSMKKITNNVLMPYRPEDYDHTTLPED